MEITMEQLQLACAELEDQKKSFVELVDAGMTYEEVRINLVVRGRTYGQASDFIEMLETATKRKLPGDRPAPLPARRRS